MKTNILFFSLLITFCLFYPTTSLAESPSISALRSTTKSISKAVHSNIKKTIHYQTKSNLNMRKKPKGTILQTLRKGEKVTIIDRSQGIWWLVSHNEQEGWVHSSYLVEM